MYVAVLANTCEYSWYLPEVLVNFEIGAALKIMKYIFDNCISLVNNTYVFGVIKVHFSVHTFGQFLIWAVLLLSS